MIVKVQLAAQVNGPPGPPRVLVYDQSLEYLWEGDASSDVVELMAGEEKAFFHATFEGGYIRIGDPAPWAWW